MNWIVEPTNTGDNDDPTGLDCAWIFATIGAVIGACLGGPFCRSLCVVKCYHEDC